MVISKWPFKQLLTNASSLCICIFISPNKFCAAESASTLRTTVIKSIKAGEIISTSRIRVFSEVSNYPIISILSKNQAASASFFVRQVEELTQLKNKYSVKRYYSAKHTDFELLPSQVIPINIDQNTFNLLGRLYAKGEMISEFISEIDKKRLPLIIQEADASFSSGIYPNDYH